ncbi:PLP-dependent transferase [Arsenicicoccus piscis]|uniref:trans-sulfuration enzyme family protein n=1 Tax=Arsenicicoccus piscis TaxID=673954 RepID=UPI001F4C77D8|nr:PLP-dependent transferase [Arsenicicoccus piscis]MCH8626904.1 PLP-dependent transferase [Arsenicicoccus piscis]
MSEQPFSPGADPQWAGSTRAVALGRPAHRPGAPVNPGIELTSTYLAGGDPVYARGGNATWTAFEEVLGSLEGGCALVYASGMAAIAAVFALVPVGGVVVVPDNAYNTTLSLADELLASGRLAEVRRVDVADTAAVTTAVRSEPHPQLVWLESPTNPLLDVADITALADATHQVGAIVVCDNTFATPILQQPLTLGADVVVHSVTKYLSGHSDVVLGAACAVDAQLLDRLRTHRTVHGSIAGPFETWLALRGIRTLPLRLERAGRSARVLADRLIGHPQVERVRYPGFGAIVSIEVAGGLDAADRVAGATRLWTNATSLGGVESLIERRRRHANEPTTVPVNLLRLSVGVEDVEDLWTDLERALDGAR